MTWLYLLLATSFAAHAISSPEPALSADTAPGPQRATDSGAVPDDPDSLVWRMEQAYWEAQFAADDSTAQSFWDETGIYWPSNSVHPQRGRDVGMTLGSIVRSFGGSITDHQLVPEAIQVRGDVAVVAFSYRWSAWLEDKLVHGSARGIHTWVADGTKWRLLSAILAEHEAKVDGK